MDTTPLGLPYPEGSDPPDGATQIRSLAEATDQQLSLTGAVCGIQRAGVSIPSAVSQVTTGWAALAGMSASVPGVLTYSAGQWTAQRACTVQVHARARWNQSMAGLLSYIAITVGGVQWEDDSSFDQSRSSGAHTHSGVGVLGVGSTIPAVSWFQNSGAAVNADLMVAVTVLGLS